MRMRDGVRERRQGSLIREIKFALLYHWLNNFTALISLYSLGSPEWRPPLLTRVRKFEMKTHIIKSPQRRGVYLASIGVRPCLCHAQGHWAISFFSYFHLNTMLNENSRTVSTLKLIQKFPPETFCSSINCTSKRLQRSFMQAAKYNPYLCLLFQGDLKSTAWLI